MYYNSLLRCLARPPIIAHYEFIFIALHFFQALFRSLFPLHTHKKRFPECCVGRLIRMHSIWFYYYYKNGTTEYSTWKKAEAIIIVVAVVVVNSAELGKHAQLIVDATICVPAYTYYRSCTVMTGRCLLFSCNKIVRHALPQWLPFNVFTAHVTGRWLMRAARRRRWRQRTREPFSFFLLSTIEIIMMQMKRKITPKRQILVSALIPLFLFAHQHDEVGFWIRMPTNLKLNARKRNGIEMQKWKTNTCGGTCERANALCNVHSKFMFAHASWDSSGPGVNTTSMQHTDKGHFPQ